MAEPFFIAPRLLLARPTKMWEPKEKKDPNKIKVAPVDIFKQPKLTPEELEADMKANRGTGAHNTSKKDDGKRKNNPKYRGDHDY
jgi:hypothetical protein